MFQTQRLWWCLKRKGNVGFINQTHPIFDILNLSLCHRFAFSSICWLTNFTTMKLLGYLLVIMTFLSCSEYDSPIAVDEISSGKKKAKKNTYSIDSDAIRTPPNKKGYEIDLSNAYILYEPFSSSNSGRIWITDGPPMGRVPMDPSNKGWTYYIVLELYSPTNNNVSTGDYLLLYDDATNRGGRGFNTCHFATQAITTMYINDVLVYNPYSVCWKMSDYFPDYVPIDQYVTLEGTFGVGNTVTLTFSDVDVRFFSKSYNNVRGLGYLQFTGTIQAL